MLFREMLFVMSMESLMVFWSGVFMTRLKVSFRNRMVRDA